MNTQEILSKGECIGEGSSRKAFLYKGKIYKVPFNQNGILQLSAEKKIYTKNKHKYGYYFPNPKFSSDYVEMDRVTLIDEVLGYWTDNPIEEMLEKKIVPWKVVANFMGFLRTMEQQGLVVDEFLYSGCNVGLIQERIVLIDWGYVE